MSLKRRIEKLEHQARIRALSQLQERVESLSDDELTFQICHGCPPQELQGKITREVRQYTENGLRVTIVLEAVE